MKRKIRETHILERKDNHVALIEQRPIVGEKTSVHRTLGVNHRLPTETQSKITNIEESVPVEDRLDEFLLHLNRCCCRHFLILKN